MQCISMLKQQVFSYPLYTHEDQKTKIVSTNLKTLLNGPGHPRGQPHVGDAGVTARHRPLLEVADPPSLCPGVRWKRKSHRDKLS